MSDRRDSGFSSASARRRKGRVLAAIAVATLAVGAAACSPDDKPEAKTSSTPMPTHTPSAPASSLPAVPLVSAGHLAKIALPKPAGMPQTGKWTDAPTGDDGNGNRLVNYVVDGSKYYLRVHFMDCRKPAFTNPQGKPMDQLGDSVFCFLPTTGSLKGYRETKPTDATNPTRVLVVNHLLIEVTPGAAADLSVAGPAMENYLKSLDLESIEAL